MRKYNLLNQKKIYRKVTTGTHNKESYREKAMKFGREYFDGTRKEGYGGYRYDGRWVPIAKRIIKKWRLGDGDKVLDIGCAKGFLLEDIHRLSPKISLYGLDISSYAKSKANPLIRDKIKIFDCNNKLPFDSKSFDAFLQLT